MSKPQDLSTLHAVPIATIMSKKDKLLRWAELIRKTNSHIQVFYSIEYMNPEQLQQVYGAQSPFEIASKDPVFIEAGLTGNTAYDSKQFFELTQNELHWFTCGCHGAISNEEMASRIAHLAYRQD